MSSQSSKSLPHIIFLFPDQLRSDFLSAYGHPAIQTPNIDRLAASGTIFRQNFTTSPLCGPARHSMAKGLYPHNSNCWEDPDCMEPDADTYMRRLQTTGYRTCLVGKAHFYRQQNVDLKPFEGFMHGLGFEDVYETGGSWSNLGARTIYDDYLKGVGDGSDEKLYAYYRYLDRLPDVKRRFIAEPSPLPQEHVLDSFIGKTAVDYIDRYDDERPCFLFVGFQGPHEPWDAPEPYASMYKPQDFAQPISELPQGDWLPQAAHEYAQYAQYFQPERREALREVRANYCGKISLIDAWIGRILDACAHKGWLENTVILFASDHGDMLGDLNRISKSMFFEGAIRVPLIVSIPDGPRGSSVSSMTELIDVYPTILESAGCAIEEHRDGQSLVPLIRGETHALRDDVLGEVHVHTMIRTADWKYVADNSGAGLQLFDLKNDPGEQRNLVGHRDYTAQEAHMRERMLRRLLKSQFHSSNRDPKFSAHVAVS